MIGKKLAIVVKVLCTLTAQAYAQSASVSGFVTDASDGRALEMAHVILKADDGSLHGATTSRDGLFIISRLEPRRYRLEARYVGYEIHEDTLLLTPGESRTLNIALVPSAEMLDEALVEGERSGGAALVTAGQQTIRAADLEMIPTPDVAGDLAAYLTAQPGVVSTGDRGGQLFIRGGEPAHNLVQLDGILLYQPFHILGFYSAFPEEIINSADVYAGGFSSKFGGRISSVIDVTTRSGHARRFGGSVAISPFVSAFQLEGPVYPNRISFLASIRESNLDGGAARYVDHPLPFAFGDAFGKINAVLTPSTRASVTALRTHDRGTLNEGGGGVPPEEIQWTNDAIGLRLLSLPRFVSLMADLHVSFSRYRSELGRRNDPSRFSEIANTHIALNASYFGDRIDVDAGTSLRVSTLNNEIGGLFQNVDVQSTSVSNWGNYLELDIDVGGGLHVRPGLRVQFYKVRYWPYPEPRIRAVWERGIHEISAAGGVYHQEVVGLSDRRDAASVFTVWTSTPSEQSSVSDVRKGRIQRAVHAIAGYRVSPFPWLDASVEGFYKDLENLFIPEWTTIPQLTTRLEPASGRAAGADLRLEVRKGPFYGFVNYGLSTTTYTPHSRVLQYWFGEEDPRFRPPHDRTHQINLLASASIGSFDVSARWQFGSGLPYSRAFGFDGFALIDDLEQAYEIQGTRRVLYERPYNGVLPTYHRLDVSAERTFNFSRFELTIQASVINVYDRRNLFYLDVFTLRRVNQLPVVPSIGVKVAFG